MHVCTCTWNSIRIHVGIGMELFGSCSLEPALWVVKRTWNLTTPLPQLSLSSNSRFYERKCRSLTKIADARRHYISAGFVDWQPNEFLNDDNKGRRLTVVQESNDAEFSVTFDVTQKAILYKLSHVTYNVSYIHGIHNNLENKPEKSTYSEITGKYSEFLLEKINILVNGQLCIFI